MTCSGVRNKLKERHEGPISNQETTVRTKYGLGVGLDWHWHFRTPKPQITPNNTSNRDLVDVPLASDVRTVVGGNDDEFEIETLSVAHSDHDENEDEVLRPRLKQLRCGCRVEVGLRSGLDSGAVVVDDNGIEDFSSSEDNNAKVFCIAETPKPKLPHPLSNPSAPEPVSPSTFSGHSSNSDSVHSSGHSTDGPSSPQTPPAPEVQTPISSAAHTHKLFSVVAPALTATTTRFPSPTSPHGISKPLAQCNV
nr:hypothetical protein [Tanacetum cinerariifolium]